jgi:hypothetical protein
LLSAPDLALGKREERELSYDPKVIKSTLHSRQSVSECDLEMGSYFQSEEQIGVDFFSRSGDRSVWEHDLKRSHSVDSYPVAQRIK